jgi:hypothetical protein
MKASPDNSPTYLPMKHGTMNKIGETTPKAKKSQTIVEKGGEDLFQRRGSLKAASIMPRLH